MPGNRTDYGTEQTDRAVKRVERRLSSVYRQAQRDIDDKLKDWQERHKKRDARYRQMVAAGEMSKEDYRAWLRGQVFQEKQWQARRDEIDNILLNADRAAQNIVNEGKLGVFAANANYMGYTLERDSNIDTGFVLYSEGTVARLIEDDPQILPKPAPGVKKELAFPYYNKLMTSAITQGIVQGETISEIAGRVARTTGESSYKSAMRNARTAYTGAQNAGRIEGLHQAQRLGIKVKKKWLAILDSRTRDTHKDLDGQTQEVDDPFVVDGDEIKFPGDPTAKPALTYNCRCTLTYVYSDYPSTMPRRDAENGQIVADMTYREWEALKKGEEAVSVPIEQPKFYKSVQGTDLRDTWKRDSDGYVFAINDIVHAQGFDGVPHIVDADEFERIARDFGRTGQRAYTAPDQETLDAYRESLYSGEWYIDCSHAHHALGRGMYVATAPAEAATEQELSEHIKQYASKSRYANIEHITLLPGSKVGEFRALEQEMAEYCYSANEAEILDTIHRLGNTGESETRVIEILKAGASSADFYMKFFALESQAEQEAVRQCTELMYGENTRMQGDVGVYAALLGYDAVRDDTGATGDIGNYMTVLNRTRCVIRRPE